MKKRSFYALAGEICILLALAGFLFIGYPVILVYVFPGKPISLTELQSRKGYTIAIPKIHAESAIIPNIDPWNEAIYLPALQKGVAQAKGTALPGEKGTIFLFAHSSSASWETTRTNIPFLRLGELQYGDSIYLAENGKIQKYVVYNKTEVWPDQIQYLNNKNKNQLILQTCTPIGTSLKRLLVFARTK